MPTLGRVLYDQLLDAATKQLEDSSTDITKRIIEQPIIDSVDGVLDGYVGVYGSLPEGVERPDSVSSASKVFRNKEIRTYANDVLGVTLKSLFGGVAAAVEVASSMITPLQNVFESTRKSAEDRKSAQDVAQTVNAVPPSTGGMTSLVFTSSAPGAPVVIVPGAPLPI